MGHRRCFAQLWIRVTGGKAASWLNWLIGWNRSRQNSIGVAQMWLGTSAAFRCKYRYWGTGNDEYGTDSYGNKHIYGDR